MYKEASEKVHSLTRTGSFATKHSATGKGGVLPPSADPWAVIFNDLRAQRAILTDQIERLDKAIEHLGWQLRMSSDSRDQRKLLTKFDALSKWRGEKHAESSVLRQQIIVAAKSSVGARFMAQAQAMLLSEQYDAIHTVAKTLAVDEGDEDLWKTSFNRLINHSKPKSEHTPEQKAKDNIRRKVTRHRQQMRRHAGLSA